MAVLKRKPARNLLTLVPVRKLEHRMEAETGKATLIVPRFQTAWVRKLFSGFMTSETVEVRLDELGTAAWLAMDGTADVAGLTKVLRNLFGERAEPVNERVGFFVYSLKRSGFIELRDPPSIPSI